METFSIGPLVVDAGRLFAFIAFAALVLGARLAERRLGPGLGDWAWAVGLAALIGARLVHVLRHLGSYGSDPLTVLYIWQGGFDAWGAGAAALLVTWWRLRVDRRRFRTGLALLTGTALLLAGLNALPLGPDLSDRRLPSLHLERIEEDGDPVPVDLGDFAGRPLLVNLWATWCPPCRRELPLLAEYARTDTTVTYLLVDQGETAERVVGYLEGRGLRFPHLLLDAEGSLARHFEAPGLPTTLLFDRSGRMVAARLGEVSRAWLDRALEQARELP